MLSVLRTLRLQFIRMIYNICGSVWVCLVVAGAISHLLKFHPENIKISVCIPVP